MKINKLSVEFICICVVLLPYFTNGAFKRCFKCRSRGDLGDCKDPFAYTNTSLLKEHHGVEAIPCASGWCGKILEGGSSFKEDEYGIATERLCLLKSQPDNEERCAEVEWKYKKVYMCFCQGDLCNNSPSIYSHVKLALAFAIGMLLLL